MNRLILFLAILWLITGHVRNVAQEINDQNRIALSVWIPETIDGMPAYAIAYLESRLAMIASNNGLSVLGPNSRFVITANVEVLTKDITPTAPPMQAYTLILTLFVGDGYDGIAYSNYSTSIKGVGETEAKAYLAALRNIKVNDPGYEGFIEKGKSKIIAYYNAQCDIIIKRAQVLAATNNFDEALWHLTGVPDACSDCWNKSMNAAIPIFQKRIDFECRLKLNEATNIWNAGQDWEAANRAGEVLSSIDPNSSCFGEINRLAERISLRIREIDNREWNFSYDKEIGLKRDMIQAIRDIGVAWGQGQPKNVMYKSLW